MELFLHPSQMSFKGEETKIFSSALQEAFGLVCHVLLNAFSFASSSHQTLMFIIKGRESAKSFVRR